MLKRVGDLTLNSVINKDGNRFYVIDRDEELGLVLIQSECGQVADNLPMDTEVDVIAEVPVAKIRGFEPVVLEKLKHVSKEEAEQGVPYFTMPKRKTARSAGYDFCSATTIDLLPGQVFTFWTNVKAYMQDNEELRLSLRSGLASKGLMLMNGIGVVDSDYYSCEDNDGNIGFCIKNTNENSNVLIVAGDRIGQGVFQNYLVADNDIATGTRSGGFGSTGR